ncbi:MAG: ABC-type transport system involved in cytochrome c biogenesis permease component [bacterium]|jgi:ABC-type transport system involved in cytochrome c biogenesis permease component
MIRLIAKEFRQLRPIAYLWLAIILFGYVIQFFTERVDENTFGSWCEGYCDYNSNITVAVFTILLALVTAYSLFPREHDESTIDFLRALPVSRASIFMAKVFAAWMLLVLLNVLSYGFDAFLLASNPESIGGKFYGQVWFTLLWRDCLFIFIILSHGVLLSWFRTLGLILYFLYLLILVLAETYLGTSGDWSVFTLLSNEYSGSDLVVNARALTIHAIAAIFILFISFRLWNRSESGGTERKKGSRSFRFVQIISAAIGFLMLSGLLVFQIQVGTGTAPDQTLKVVATEHYRFVYDTSKSRVVDYIVEHAEADLAELADLMGVKNLPRIRVDLTAQSEHAVGLAKWKKIQIDLDGFENDVSQRRVLVHEATHVLQAVESDRAMANNYNAVKFFIEGMAQYTSFEVVPEIGRRQSNWGLASVAWKRQNIEFNDLIDASSFSEEFDAELHYSLGDLWAAAFVDTCGDSSLGDFVRATGRDNASKGLIADFFWRDTMQAIGCDLDTVNARWQENMSSLYEQVEKESFPEFVDISIRRDEGSNRIKVVATLVANTNQDSNSVSVYGSSSAIINDTAPSFAIPDRYIIRIRNVTSKLAAGVDHTFRGRLITDGVGVQVEFLFPDYVVPNIRFRYQIGYTPSRDSRYYYESWRRGSVSSSGQP